MRFKDKIFKKITSTTDSSTFKLLENETEIKIIENNLFTKIYFSEIKDIDDITEVFVKLKTFKEVVEINKDNFNELFDIKETYYSDSSLTTVVENPLTVNFFINGTAIYKESNKQ